jgi:hypothetical protein
MAKANMSGQMETFTPGPSKMDSSMEKASGRRAKSHWRMLMTANISLIRRTEKAFLGGSQEMCTEGTTETMRGKGKERWSGSTDQIISGSGSQASSMG